MKKPGEISTDKVIAVGLIISCNIYAFGSIYLGAPPSGELLGTLFGGIIGALGRWAPTPAKNEEQTQQSKTSETLEKVAATATEAKNIVNAVDSIKELTKARREKE